MGEETPGNSESGADLRHAGALMPTDQVKRWFVREVLPLESMLMRFLSRNWRDKTEIEDFRQEVYAQVLAAAEIQIPERAKPFLLSTARNLLIDRIRREHIVSIEAVADLDVFGLAADEPGPDRNLIARDVLRKLQIALNRLPPRCREAVILKRIEGLSRREIARRMDITEQTVADHVARGMRVLADTLYDDRAGDNGE